MLSFIQESSAQTEKTITLKINTFSKEVPYKDYSRWFNFVPLLIIDGSYVSEIENSDFCLTSNIFCDLSKTEKEKMHTRKNVLTLFNEESALKFLEELAKEAYETPVNAKFKMDDKKVTVFTADKNGFELDTQESLNVLSSTFLNDLSFENTKEVLLSYKVLIPEIKSRDVNDIGINTLIGKGTSNFKGSTKSRIHNIKVATEKYDGFLLAPGEEFSFVDILGPVDGENGYLPELVIKQDRTEPEFGGGICQVSTTIFRAAIYAGLEITARKNHAYPVKYYAPHGMDATIYIPKPDLKFKNNTPEFILIQAQIEGTELTFNLFGTFDDRNVEIDGPHIIENNPDGSMRTTFSQKVLDSNDKVIINDTFNSYYDSPSKYPQPDDEKFTKKPSDWSNKQWDAYKKANGL